MSIKNINAHKNLILLVNGCFNKNLLRLSFEKNIIYETAKQK